LEAEELFSNVYLVTRVQTVSLSGKICMKFLHCFGAGMLFICNLHFFNFSEKKQSAAIYFPPLLQCKTNTSALEILTEMIIPSPRNFFLNPVQFPMFTLFQLSGAQDES